MTTKYPNQVDTNTEIPLSTDAVTKVDAVVTNTLRGAVLAIESELGADPSREYGTVRTRLDALQDQITALAASGGGGGGGGTTTVGGDLSGTLPNPSVIDLTITGEQRGSILYFNGTSWVQLAPSTDGYILKTHGAGANPTWATEVGSQVINDSGISGTTVTDALNTLNGRVILYEVVEATLTGALTITTGTSTIPVQTGGSALQATFSAWNSGDIVKIEWWFSGQSVSTGGSLGIYPLVSNNPVKNGGGGTTVADSSGSDKGIAMVNGSCSIARTANPVVKLVVGAIDHDISVNPSIFNQSVMLRISRYAAQHFTPAGSL